MTRVAIVHDWLTGYRGGEKCLQELLRIYPSADVFTLFHVPGKTTPEIDARVRATSFLGKLPGVARSYRALLPLYPIALDFDLSSYDLVISISHAAAKNVRVGPNTLHVSYILTPMRYIWDQVREYLGPLTPLAWPLVLLLRAWDRAGSRGVDHFVAISRFVAARVRCFYGRPADVIFPPVDTSAIAPRAEGEPGEAFLCAGALVPYKRVDVAIQAFAERPQDTLWIVGAGPELKRLQNLATPNVQFLGRLSDQELHDRLRRCRALLFPGTEDFGMVPIESMAAGRPVIGHYSGALRETVLGLKTWGSSPLAAEESTGVFFRGDRRSLRSALDLFSRVETRFCARSAISHAAHFSVDRFQEEWGEMLGRLTHSLPAGKRLVAERLQREFREWWGSTSEAPKAQRLGSRSC